MKVVSWLIGAGLAGLATSALAAPTDAKPAHHDDCFMSGRWSGWHSPAPNVIYLRVNVGDIYRIDLSAGSPMLLWPDVHLVNHVRGSDYICTPLDLDLSVAESGGGGGIREPLIAKAITKLTPEQIAAIPKKDLP